jgi:hypothetical protein
MKKALLFALALIAAGCADTGQSAFCESLSDESPLEDLRTCAEQGNANAQVRLGWMYATGEGVPEDVVLAYMWANLAAAQGSSAAPSVKIIIEERMTREQIDEAQRLSREWLEPHPPGGN